MRDSNRLVYLCILLLSASACSVQQRTGFVATDSQNGCSTPFTIQPSVEAYADIPPVVLPDATMETIPMIHADSVSTAPAITTIESSTLTALPVKEIDRRGSAEIDSSPDFDWQFFWVGVAYSLLLPFLMPALATYTTALRDEKTWKVRLCFFAFLLALAAFTLAIIFIVKSNPLWLLFYVTSVLVSVACTIKMSFLHNGRFF